MNVIPVTLLKHKRYFEIVQKELKKKYSPIANDMGLIHAICNISYDCICDRWIMKELKDNLKHRLKCDLETIQKKMKEEIKKMPKEEAKKFKRPLPNHPLWQLLMAYYNRLVKEELVKIPDPNSVQLGNKIYDIICSKYPYEKKIEKIAKLLSAQEFMKDSAEFLKFIEWFEKTLGKKLRRIVTKEMNKKTESEIKRELEECVDPKKKDKKLIYGLAKAMGITIEDWEYYKMKARKKIRFKLKSKTKTGVKIIKGGLEVWRIDDEAEDLEAEESIREYGILIPEMTTLKFEKKMGVEDPRKKIPSTVLILDTSGSMNVEQAIVTCYSFIEACRHYNVDFSVILFSDDAYLSTEFSREYNKIEKLIHDRYSSGGTDIFPAICKLKEIIRKRNNTLIIIISDFCAARLNQSLDILKRLKKDHSVVLMVIRSGTEFPGFNFYNVNKIDDLDNLVIKELNEYVM
ncbi:MAG: vWA domain-containing protein [Candidatus Asgardarchaeia archaeon]